MNPKISHYLLTFLLFVLVLSASVVGYSVYMRFKANINVISVTQFKCAIYLGGTTWGTNLTSNTSNTTTSTQWGNQTSIFATGDFEFNSTSLTITNITPQGVGGTAPQNSGQGILRCSNSGNVAITNFGLNLSAMPTCGGGIVNLSASSTSISAGFLLLNSSEPVILSASLAAGANLDVWTNASFNACVAGTSTNVNYQLMG